MARKDRKRQGLLSRIFRRKRRSSRPSHTSSISEVSGSPVKKKFRLKQFVKGLKRSVKTIGSGSLAPDERTAVKDVTLGSILRSVTKVNKAESLPERDSAAGGAGKRKLSRLQKLKLGIIENAKRLTLAAPAIVVSIFVLQLWLDLTPSRLVSQLGFTNRFDRAFEEQRLEEANLLVKNQLSSTNRPGNQDLFRYGLILGSQQKLQRTRELLDFLTESSDRSYGPAHIEMARAYSALPKQTDQTSSKIESHLIRAMVDPDTEPFARISLGRLYRSRGRFNDAERILEPIRTNEEACLELALVRNAQGRYVDVPTTVAPYITRWRDQWKNPQDLVQFEHSAIGLILMKDEAIVLAELDHPKVPIPPSRIDELRRLALGLWITRLQADGRSQYPQILKIISEYHQKLPCSSIWIAPLMQLTEPTSPVRNSALKLREQMTFQTDCDPAYLHEFAVQGKESKELVFARQIYEKILLKYPDEILSLNNLAMMLIESNPKDPQRALKLVEPIIQKYPDFLEIYDTRAQIKSSMGLTKDCIQDYLKALPVYCLKPEYHQRLSKAYQQINDTANARMHNELARELSGLE
jgi:tetratricopeptide (TPR) repeat protein